MAFEKKLLEGSITEAGSAIGLHPFAVPKHPVIAGKDGINIPNITWVLQRTFMENSDPNVELLF
jgi:hypothetical protein